MPRPGINYHSTSVECTSFEPVQALLLDEVETELTEPEARSVVSEPCSQHHIYEAVRVARSITVTILHTQVRHPQQGKAPQIRVTKVSRCYDFRQDFHRRPTVWIGHKWQ